MGTKENLEAAFAGESQANRKYLAFARKAEEEGRPQIARLFRAAAEAETVHAHNHLKVMGEIGDTEKNLKHAIDGEHYEHTRMYPDFIEDAEKEEKPEAARTFRWANEVEKVHENHFQKALEALGGGRDIGKKEIEVCSVCGNTFLGDSPDACPICGTPRSGFMKIE